jgi:hypothetical protein
MGAHQYYKNKEHFLGNSHTKSHEKAQVELPTILLEKLILSGLLPGNECKCLDDSARKTVWRSLLQGSLNGEQSLCL